MNCGLRAAVVADEAQISKFVHEVTHARPCSANQLRERLLADLRDDRFGSTVLAKIRQQEKGSCQALLARIEQLINEVLLNSDGPSQEMRDEHLGKRRLVMEDPDHGRLLQPHDLAFIA